MNTVTKTILITLIFAIPAFALGPVLWPPSPDVGPPTAGQLPFFIILSAVEALVFGVGVAYLFLVRPRDSSALARAEYFAIAWFLVSWWPHDNLHIHNGMDLQGLLYIEYGFHITLIIASLIIVYALISRAKTATASGN